MLASTSNADHQPFRLTPDPEFVYISPAQLVAYSRLFSAIHRHQKCLLLTGDPGTGKTLLLRRLLLDLENAGIAVCAFWNPVSSPDQLWAACCERAGLSVDPSQETDLRSVLLGSLRENAASMVLLLDEADAIPILVLEAIAGHFAASPGKKAAVSVLLCGQPAFQRRLRLLGMAASITTSIRLEPLHRREIEHFIRHHLRAQAGKVEYQFSPGAVERIIAHCGGLPAQINTLCSGALLLAELEGQTTVTAEIIDELAADNWMTRGSPLTNDPFTPTAEAEPARVVKGAGNLFDGLGNLPTSDLEADAERQLDDSFADRDTVQAARTNDSADTLFAGVSRSQTQDRGAALDLSTNDAMENAAPPGSDDGGSSDPPSGERGEHEQSADSKTTDNDADEPAPTALSPDPGLGDFQTLNLVRFPRARPREEATIPARHQRLRAFDPLTAQGPSAEHRHAKPTRPSRRRRRLLARASSWLAFSLLLGVAAGSVYVSKNRIPQAMTWIEATSSDVAAWFAWTPSSATIAWEPTEKSTPVASHDDAAALSQTREVKSHTERTAHSESSTPTTSSAEVELSDRSPRKQPPAVAQPAETYLPNEPDPPAQNQDTALRDTGGAAMIAAVPPTTPPMEISDPIPARITTSDDVTPIARVPVTAAAKESKSQPHVRLVSQINGREDSAIFLAIEPANLPASEYEVEVHGVPQGASLSVGRLTDGVWTVPVEDFSKLALTPKVNSDDDIPLTLRLVRTSDRRDIHSVQMTVSVSAVADEPKLSVSAADGDQFTAIPIEIRTWLLDKDGSERLSVTVSGLPNSVELSAGRRIDDQWILAPADLAGLFMTPMEGAPSELRLAIEAVATESSNGDRAVARRQVELNVVPANR